MIEPATRKLPPNKLDLDSQMLRGIASLIFLLGFMPGIAGANPVRDPTSEMGELTQIGVACVALVVEIALVAHILIPFYKVDRRWVLVISLILLNAASYLLFIVLLFPRVGSVLGIEFLIWLVEAVSIRFICRPLANRPPRMIEALAVALIGNLFSYLFGAVA